MCRLRSIAGCPTRTNCTMRKAHRCWAITRNYELRSTGIEDHMTWKWYDHQSFVGRVSLHNPTLVIYEPQGRCLSRHDLHKMSRVHKINRKNLPPILVLSCPLTQKLVFGSPVSQPEKDRDWTGPRPIRTAKDRRPRSGLRSFTILDR